MTVKITIQLSEETTQELTYEHVHKMGITPPGLYTFENSDGNCIGQVPLARVLHMRIPEHETSLSLISR